MEGRFILSKVIEVMQSGVDPIELGVGQYMDIVCRNIEKWSFLRRMINILQTR